MAARGVMEIGCLEAIKEFILLNLGVAMLPPWVAARELRHGQLLMRPTGRKLPRRAWTAFFRSNRELVPVEARFIRLCRAQATGLRMDRNDLAPRRAPSAQ